MARQVKGRPAGVVYEFVPKAFDNDRDTDPVKFFIKAPNDAQRRDIVTVDENSPSDQMRSVKRAVSNHIIKVENYNDTTGKPITDARELITHGETEFLVEVFQELLTSTAIKEAQKK